MPDLEVAVPLREYPSRMRPNAFPVGPNAFPIDRKAFGSSEAICHTHFRISGWVFRISGRQMSNRDAFLGISNRHLRNSGAQMSESDC